MKNFDEFWEKHGPDYIEHAKSIALADFKSLSAGAFVAHVEIDTDDDFCLEGGTSFSIYGNTKKETLQKTIDYLKNVQLDVPDWAKKEDGSVESRYTSKWTWVRDQALEQLEKGQTDVSLGGNQTIEISITKTQPILSSIKLK